MRCRRVRVLAMAAGSAVLLASSGCVIAFDALDPAFFAGLGFDPGTIFPTTGTIIVSFTNNTDSVATFYAFESVNSRDLRQDSRNFVVEVDADESGNEVLTCPVGVISLGSLDAAFSIQELAVSAVGAEGATEINYLGTPLIEGSDYTCGDVIDVRLDTDYTLTVRVLPGG